MKIGELEKCELVELHYYFLNTEREQTGKLDRHEDDEGGVSYKTITLIWYLKKSPTINKGNLKLFRTMNPSEEGITIKTGKMDKDNNICSCVIFTGDIIHSPEKMFGIGERSGIVFQFERKSK